MCYQSYGESVKHRVIQKYFWKAGILDEDFNPLTLVEDDPFAEADMQLQDLISRALPEPCPVEEYIDGENSLATCNDFTSETWESDFLDSITLDLDGNIDDEDTHSDGGDGEDQPVTPPKLKIIREIVELLYDIKWRF
jgi:hypothetical protein